MTRASQTISLVLLASSIYLLLLLPLLTSSSPVPSLLPPKIQIEIIPVLPFWALVTLGAYLLSRLGYGLLSYKNTEEAHAELMGQIEEAKERLSKRGVAYD